MQPNKLLLMSCLALMLSSCIKSYEPVIDGSDINKIVISGQVTDLDGNQIITISRASSTLILDNKPVTGCIVIISDSMGNQFPLSDKNDGTYNGRIDPKFLYPGNSFMLSILTREGDSIVSEFDRMLSCPEVDSVYYLRRNIPTNNPDEFVKGIQFYADFNGSATNSRSYRFEAYETWEYHAEYPIEWYYDGRVHHVWPPDTSKDTCWTTALVKEIYTLSTQHLSENNYRQISLNFVDNTTVRLVYGYSLLLNQYSLTNAALDYWNQLKINSTQNGSLYQRQPLSTKGNLRNTTHPSADVLGFFGASSIKSKRIFVRNVEGLPSEYYSFCTPQDCSPYGFSDFYNMDFPIYLMGDQNGYQCIILDAECVDCRALGGTTIRPAYWPWP